DPHLIGQIRVQGRQADWYPKVCRGIRLEQFVLNDVVAVAVPSVRLNQSVILITFPGLGDECRLCDRLPVDPERYEAVRRHEADLQTALVAVHLHGHTAQREVKFQGVLESAVKAVSLQYLLDLFGKRLVADIDSA